MAREQGECFLALLEAASSICQPSLEVTIAPSERRRLRRRRHHQTEASLGIQKRDHGAKCTQEQTFAILQIQGNQLIAVARSHLFSVAFFRVYLACFEAITAPSRRRRHSHRHQTRKGDHRNQLMAVEQDQDFLVHMEAASSMSQLFMEAITAPSERRRHSHRHQTRKGDHRNQLMAVEQDQDFLVHMEAASSMSQLFMEAITAPSERRRHSHRHQTRKGDHRNQLMAVEQDQDFLVHMEAASSMSQLFMEAITAPSERRRHSHRHQTRKGDRRAKQDN